MGGLYALHAGFFHLSFFKLLLGRLLTKWDYTGKLFLCEEGASCVLLCNNYQN